MPGVFKQASSLSKTPVPRSSAGMRCVILRVTPRQNISVDASLGVCSLSVSRQTSLEIRLITSGHASSCALRYTVGLASHLWPEGEVVRPFDPGKARRRARRRAGAAVLEQDANSLHLSEVRFV